MAQTQKERSPMEDNIIKVVLYLFRNIAMIAEPEDFVPDDYQSDISRSSTIDAFHYQDIFSLILTVCSSMTEEFRTHDLEILETVFYLVKGVDVERLFMDHDELVHAKTTELQSLISKEKAMLASYKRNGPSRHNRFGTMVWLKREDGKATAAFGQRALKNEQQALEELDQKKKWKRPTRPKKKDEKETPIVRCSPRLRIEYTHNSLGTIRQDCTTDLESKKSSQRLCCKVLGLLFQSSDVFDSSSSRARREQPPR
jgi:replication fork protection complex subunit Tof1/Swi1